MSCSAPRASIWRICKWIYLANVCRWNEIHCLFPIPLVRPTRLHCLFVDTSLNFYHHRQSQHQNYIYDLLNHLIECVRLGDKRTGDDEDDEEDDDDDVDEEDDDDEVNHYRRNHRRRDDRQPDIRIILCMFCGDPFSVESVLQPLLAEPTCELTGEKSIIFETFLGDTKRKIEVIMSSYHGANAFRDELVHGFILLFSTKRRASLATLK